MAVSRLAIIPFCILGLAPQSGCRGSSVDDRAPGTGVRSVETRLKSGPDDPGGQVHPGRPGAGDPLRAAADRTVRDLHLPEGTWRFQNHADTIDSFEGGRNVLISRSFLYRRILDGIPVYGPGTSIQVTVDPEGTVKSVLADWPASIGRTIGAEAYSHLDLDELVSREVKEAPRGCRVVNLGLCYRSQQGPGGLEAVPVVGVRIVPEGPGGPGLGQQFYLPLRP